jgi:hypothetical protein
MAPWVEEAGDLLRFGIEAGEVRPLVKVIVVAGQRQVVYGVLPPMLFGEDVFDVEGEKRVVGLVDATVLTAIIRVPPQEFPRELVHREPFSSRARALA